MDELCQELLARVRERQQTPLKKKDGWEGSLVPEHLPTVLGGGGTPVLQTISKTVNKTLANQAPASIS